jgi:D-amino peptidase
MSGEANAAIRGAFAGGATEVLVNDSHGTMDNLLHDQLDPRARLVFGAPRPSCMVQGITRDDDVAIFVGYHAAAGADGVLAHTFSSNFTEVRLNGQPVSEAEVNAVYAASYGVPVVALTGDDQICAVAEKAFAGVTAVEVKRAVGFSATDTLAPQAARELIESSVSSAIASAGDLRAPAVPESLDIEVDFASLLGTDYAASVPRTERTGPRTLRFAAADADELVQAIMSWYYLAALAAQQMSAVVFLR